MASMQATGSRAWWGRRSATATATAAPVVSFEQLMWIPQQHVAAALAAVVGLEPRLSRFRPRGSASSVRQTLSLRCALIDALSALDVDAQRAVDDHGVDISGGHGSSERMSRLLAALAPYVGDTTIEMSSASGRYQWAI